MTLLGEGDVAVLRVVAVLKRARPLCQFVLCISRDALSRVLSAWSVRCVS